MDISEEEDVKKKLQIEKNIKKREKWTGKNKLISKHNIGKEENLAKNLAKSILLNYSNETKNNSLQPSQEMKDIVNKYVAYIKGVISLNVDEEETQYIYYNFTVNCNEWISNSAETIIDALLQPARGNTTHIFNFIYEEVEAINPYENISLLLYALGHAKMGFYPRRDYTLHIVQPRLNHYESWSLTANELYKWDGYLKAKAEMGCLEIS